MLHLLARLEVVLPRGQRCFVADLVAPAEGRQRLVRDSRADERELLVDPHEVALARRVQLHDQLAMWLRLLRAHHLRDLDQTLAQHALDRDARDAQHVRDRARAVALLV